MESRIPPAPQSLDRSDLVPSSSLQLFLLGPRLSLLLLKSAIWQGLYDTLLAIGSTSCKPLRPSRERIAPDADAAWGSLSPEWPLGTHLPRPHSCKFDEVSED